jgi:hypothetical protein
VDPSAVIVDGVHVIRAVLAFRVLATACAGPKGVTPGCTIGNSAGVDVPEIFVAVIVKA